MPTMQAFSKRTILAAFGFMEDQVPELIVWAKTLRSKEREPAESGYDYDDEGDNDDPHRCVDGYSNADEN